MASEAIDVYCHVLPPAYRDAVRRHASPPFMFERACSIAPMVNLDARKRVLDPFPSYRQVISLCSPPVEALGHARRACELAVIANDAMADWVRACPDRFAGFVATLPWNDESGAIKEADRACDRLGALGVQVYSTMNSLPLDVPEVLSVIEHVAAKGKAIWLHPVRPMARPDYPTESVSKFDLWWAFGWPYETSMAMGRLVFSGLFDRFPDTVIIAHHCGGVVPMLEGRIATGLSRLGSRTPPQHADAIRTDLRERPIEAFRRFYADTASFGSRSSIACASEFFGAHRMLFATDMPFGGEDGAQLVRDTLHAVETLPLGEAERLAVYAGNARRVLAVAAP